MGRSEKSLSSKDPEIEDLEVSSEVPRGSVVPARGAVAPPRGAASRQSSKQERAMEDVRHKDKDEGTSSGANCDTRNNNTPRRDYRSLRRYSGSPPGSGDSSAARIRKTRDAPPLVSPAPSADQDGRMD